MVLSSLGGPGLQESRASTASHQRPSFPPSILCPRPTNIMRIRSGAGPCGHPFQINSHFYVRAALELGSPRIWSKEGGQYLFTVLLLQCCCSLLLSSTLVLVNSLEKLPYLVSIAQVEVPDSVPVRLHTVFLVHISSELRELVSFLYLLVPLKVLKHRVDQLLSELELSLVVASNIQSRLNRSILKCNIF